jgi:hypothetical protein
VHAQSVLSPVEYPSAADGAEGVGQGGGVDNFEPRAVGLRRPQFEDGGKEILPPAAFDDEDLAGGDGNPATLCG